MLVSIKENASKINIYQEAILIKKSDTPFLIFFKQLNTHILFVYAIIFLQEPSANLQPYDQYYMNDSLS